MDIPVPLPLDQDGLIRRECPSCRRQFKWHNGPANEEAEAEGSPPIYYCPICGEPAPQDAWFTEEQLTFARGNALPAVMREVQRELKHAFGKSSRGSGFRFEANHAGIPDVPGALVEPNDMQIIASPCHSYEPVKVPDDAAGPFHCLICGQRFAV